MEWKRLGEKKKEVSKRKKTYNQKAKKKHKKSPRGENEINEMVSKKKFNQLTECHSLESQPVSESLIKLLV